MNKTDLLAMLDDDFRLFCAGERGPTASDLEALELRLGRTLPKPYRDFLMQLGAVVIEVKEELWPRPKLGSIGRSWTFDHGFAVLGIGPDAPNWLCVDQMAVDLWRDYSDTADLLPFFHWIDAPERLCFGPRDLIYWWNPEEPSYRLEVDETFDQVLTRSIHALRQAKEALRGGKSIDDIQLSAFDPPFKRHALKPGPKELQELSMGEFLQRLQAIPWFENVGKNIAEREVARVSTWKAGDKMCRSRTARNVQIESQNVLTVKLHSDFPERYHKKWNQFAIKNKFRVIPMVEERIIRVAKEHLLSNAFRDAVQWDILGACMEFEYRDIVPPRYFAERAKWYLAGHWPCGWEGQFPEGRLIVY